MSKTEPDKIIYTVGHSTRSIDDFIILLHSFNIALLADIRGLPGSNRYPHFNKEALQVSLPGNDIKYIHIKELGGRRKVQPDSINTGWRLPAFRGYADYMQTDAFKKAIEELEAYAFNQRTAYMCAEVLWWRCHRALVSDYLKLRGWTVFHIMGIGKAQEHTFTSPSRIVKGTLKYP
jgi:uncharacterized protein (DUF488 family)